MFATGDNIVKLAEMLKAVYQQGQRIERSLDEIDRKLELIAQGRDAA